MLHSLDCGIYVDMPCDCVGHYLVLKPIYQKTGEAVGTEAGMLKIERIADFKVLGTAKNISEANAKFPRGFINGYSHILEWVGH